ncbi:MAG: endo alpha-1,4 polygalactosaminidase [Bacteroidia bacterium]|nr:endo alpha-1,4 polygalactosaminidase [Bacteroidia bacterium]
MIRFLAIGTIMLITTACSKEKKAQKAANKMQEFVIDISNYARSFDNDFIVIPQNGVELAFNQATTEDGINMPYMNAINGLGVEELFFNGKYSLDKERLDLLNQLKSSKKILVSEYVSANSDNFNAFKLNYDQEFICFVRENSNYNYTLIPDSVPNENNKDIHELQQVENFLYLISTDNFASKTEMIQKISASNYDLIITDLFFNDVAFSETEINQLKTKANGGKRIVLSYINIGSAEKFRYYWKKGWGLHHPLWLKKKYEGYEDEFWVKFWKKEWQDIIFGNDNSYIKKIIDAEFDGIYLDNVEAYYFLYYNN